MNHLNERQREAVLAPDGPMLILAGAGSGKTTVLIERVAELIRRGVPSWRILTITFTNKAAGELKSRLSQKLGPVGEEVWAATFHSTCVRILRREIHRLGYENGFTIYDADDAHRLMKDIVKELGLDEKIYVPKLVLGQISRAKDAMLLPAQYLRTHADDQRAEGIARCYERYRIRCRESNALDFDDLIFHTVQLLLTDAEVRAYYQQRFLHVLVDEYQDTNHLQYLLASTLAAGHGNLTVVGDDDQSIYRFRGATVENILGFAKQYADTRVIRLEQNYRSTQNILDAANGVIARNAGRHAKTLWTGNERGEPLQFFEGYSDEDEAQYVADRIIEARTKGLEFRNFAVLYRTNAQSNRIEDAFKRSGIPYRLIGGVRFYDRAEIKDMLAYLQLCCNPADDLRLQRVINTPARGIGAKTLDILAALAARDGVSQFDAARRAASYPEFGRSAAAALERFAEIIERLRQKLSGGLSLGEFYDEVLAETGYLRPLEEKNDFEARGRIENVMELKSSLVQYEENWSPPSDAQDEPPAPDAEAPALSGFLYQVSLFTDVERYDENADAAVMMTIHAAKGLEFDVVFLVGMEDGIFPGLRSMGDPEELEEERRLCYVAITRARRTLHILCARTRMMFGKTTQNPVSRFVEEIPPEALANRQKNSAAFAVRREAHYGTSPGRVRPTSSHTPGGSRAAVPSAENAAVSFTQGQRVEHQAFGPGTVLKVTAMGGDALLEVAFDSVGTKRLMKKSAGAYMKAI